MSHPNVHFPFTPTRASWLNQVEIWFSILSAKALAGASFNSLNDLTAHIDALHQGLQHRRQAVRLDQIRDSPKAPQTMLRGSIVWEHGGDITLGNRKGGGLSVRVKLPIDRE